MVQSPKARPTTHSDSLDLAAIGKTWAPPQEVDTSPEVSDVIGRMPWWASRGLLYIIIGFIGVALLWAGFSKVDIVAESRGTLVPEGYVKPVQAAGPGVVQNVFVKEGESVERGQPLVQLAAVEMRTRLRKLHEELETSESQLRQLMVNRPVAETLEQQNRIARLQSEITAAELALQHTTITAPVGGIVTTMEVRGSGEVLQSGQTIATIAPNGAKLVVEAQVLNKDIAFIEKGLPAKLKFDAFPFQDYGLIEGTVIDVSPDAQIDKELGSFYKVTIAPRNTEIAAKGRKLSLRPGLAVTAEIVTERKSILSLILEPFRKLKGDLSR
jgi:multidrug efflux pump subunit AcrA (membrane-fusion protein)